MRVFVAVFLCLAAFVEANHPEEMAFQECEHEYCDSICKAANRPSLFNLKYQEIVDCSCPCGSLRSEDCHSDGDCIFGLHCASGDTKGGHGKCEDACKKPGFSCGLFDSCHINTTGGPECLCKLWKCSDMHIGYGVCAYDHLQGMHRVFHNDCLFVNAECERRQLANPDVRLAKRPIQDCSEVIEFEDPMVSLGIGLNK